MPCAAATALPSSTSAVTSARSAGSSQTRPCVRPVRAPTGFVAALKISLRHCGPRASATAVGRHPGARARVGEPLDLVDRRRLRLEGADRRVALHVPLDVARLDDPAGREGRAADHALDVLRDRLLVADPVLHRADGAVRERVRRRGDAGSVCIAFVATIPKSQAGSSPGSRRRAQACRRPRPRPESRRPCVVDRVDVLLRRGRTPRPRRRRAAPGSPRRASRRRRSRRRRPSSRASAAAASSRPPVSPDGRRISTSAMIAPRKIRRVPCGRSSVKPSTCTPSSASLRNESRPLTASAPTTAPQRLVTPPTTSIASVTNVSSR